MSNENAPLRFSRKDPKKFFITLNKRVNEHFKNINTPKTGNWKLYIKTIFMLALVVTPYFLILFTEFNTWFKLLFALVMGIGIAGVGMNVIACDNSLKEVTINLNFFDKNSVSFNIKTISKNEVLKQADFVSLHVPAQKKYVIDKKELATMKDGSVLINAARGGVINEVALVAALDSGKLLFAALDTFENEPKPEIQLLMHPKISLTPHIGAATNEAQERIGEELASQINNLLKK